jgi:hypothetical protein
VTTIAAWNPTIAPGYVTVIYQLLHSKEPAIVGLLRYRSYCEHNKQAVIMHSKHPLWQGISSDTGSYDTWYYGLC